MKTKTPKQSHTAGPWKWRGYDSTHILAQYDDGSERGIVAQVGTDGGTFTRPEAQANARLIAAAPDLLAAAKNLLYDVDETLLDGQGPDMETHRRSDILRAAIAKAEGR